MDALLIFAGVILVYVYMAIFYFYKRSKQSKKMKSDIMIRAITYFRRENWDQAQYYFEEVYNQSIESKDLHLAAESLYYLALIFNKQGQDEYASEFVSEALNYYEHLEEEEGIQKASQLLSQINN